MYGTKLWQIIPVEWRKWWLKSVTMLLPHGMYQLNEITNLSCRVVDVTLRKDNLEKSIQSGKLGDIIASCNENLLPLVKCPWGCTEYFHLTGALSIQVVITRFITAHESEHFFSQTEVKYANGVTIGCRNDYLSLYEEDNEELLLWNPIWCVAP
jgi:hypothetical protein